MIVVPMRGDTHRGVLFCYGHEPTLGEGIFIGSRSQKLQLYQQFHRQKCHTHILFFGRSPGFKVKVGVSV